jgi:hypothetical protein
MGINGGTNSTTCSASYSDSALLAAAVDSPGLTFTWEGAAPWTVDPDGTRVGGSVARSGDIAAGQSSTLTTSLTGPALLSFDWKVTSEPGIANALGLVIDGTVQETISGDVDWRQRIYPLGSGTHIINWVYQIDPSGSLTHTGWLDNIKVTDCAGVVMTAATATVSPPSLTLPFSGTGSVDVTVSDGTTSCSAASYTVYPVAELSWIPVISQTFDTTDYVPL